MKKQNTFIRRQIEWIKDIFANEEDDVTEWDFFSFTFLGGCFLGWFFIMPW